MPNVLRIILFWTSLVLIQSFLRRNHARPCLKSLYSNPLIPSHTVIHSVWRIEYQGAHEVPVENKSLSSIWGWFLALRRLTAFALSIKNNLVSITLCKALAGSLATSAQAYIPPDLTNDDMAYIRQFIDAELNSSMLSCMVSTIFWRRRCNHGRVSIWHFCYHGVEYL